MLSNANETAHLCSSNDTSVLLAAPVNMCSPKSQHGQIKRFLSPNLCAFASLADVAKGGDGAKSALREIFVFGLPLFNAVRK